MPLPAGSRFLLPDPEGRDALKAVRAAERWAQGITDRNLGRIHEDAALTELLLSVNDDSTPAEKALWHAITTLDDWIETGLLVDIATVQRLRDWIADVLRHNPTYSPTGEPSSD
jgi:hypothetical protein